MMVNTALKSQLFFSRKTGELPEHTRQRHFVTLQLLSFWFPVFGQPGLRLAPLCAPPLSPVCCQGHHLRHSHLPRVSVSRPRGIFSDTDNLLGMKHLFFFWVMSFLWGRLLAHQTHTPFSRLPFPHISHESPRTITDGSEVALASFSLLAQWSQWSKPSCWWCTRRDRAQLPFWQHICSLRWTGV